MADVLNTIGAGGLVNKQEFIDSIYNLFGFNTDETATDDETVINTPWLAPVFAY